VEYGIFVTIEKGIDGLVHISTLENVEKNTNLKKVYKAGDKLSVQIKDVDLKAKRISLIPSSTAEQDKTAAKYLSNQDDSDTYNPFAAFFNK
jgi:small subunit ribosomal protein S1